MSRIARIAVLALVCACQGSPPIVNLRQPSDALFMPHAISRDLELLAGVKESYQNNVQTVYAHLEEIIKKIIGHKNAWTEKYKLDMKKVDDDVEKSAAAEKAAKDQNYEAAGKLGVVKAEYRDKDSSWNKAKATMEAKTADAEKQRAYLKKMYLAGLEQKAGEICMIRRIQCTVAKFNKDTHLKYCDSKHKPTEEWCPKGVVAKADKAE